MKKRLSIAGFTLPDIIVSTALISMIFAALVTASIYVQRSVTAGESYAERQAQQLQVSDYFARDVRNARDVDVELIPTGKQIVIKVPDYYVLVNGEYELRKPEFDSDGGATYGTTLRTITYRFESKTISRTSDLPYDQPSLELAKNVETFDVTLNDSSDTVTVAMTFTPLFSYSDTQAATIRDGTKAVSETLRRNPAIN